MHNNEKARIKRDAERKRFIEWMCSDRHAQCTNKIHTKGCCV